MKNYIAGKMYQLTETCYEYKLWQETNKENTIVAIRNLVPNELVVYLNKCDNYKYFSVILTGDGYKGLLYEELLNETLI